MMKRSSLQAVVPKQNCHHCRGKEEPKEKERGNEGLVSHKRPVSKEKANLGALELLRPNSAFWYIKQLKTGEKAQVTAQFSAYIQHIDIS